MSTDKVFIVGCARSGSTLLRLILNRSPRICIPPETNFLRRFSQIGKRRQIPKMGNLREDRNLRNLTELMYQPGSGWSSGYGSWLRKRIDKETLYDRLAASDRSERSIFLILLQLYAEKKKGDVGGLLLGEKTPTHLYYVPTLMSWFPDAKVIHTFRDPRGLFVSRLVKARSGQWGLKAKYPSLPGWLVDPFLGPLEIQMTARSWKDAVDLHQKYLRMYPGRYLLQRFEDLITDPKENVRNICEFLETEYHPDMTRDVVVVGSSYHEEKRKPGGFERQAIDRWKGLIDPSAKAWLTFLTRRQLVQFGYAP